MPDNCLGEARVLYGKEVTVDELLPLLLEDKEFYENSGGGVTLSGGECLCHPEFCAELLKRLKSEGINTAVDTCGFVSRHALEIVMPHTDIFLYDLKAYDEDGNYIYYTEEEKAEQRAIALKRYQEEEMRKLQLQQRNSRPKAAKSQPKPIQELSLFQGMEL